MPDLFDIKGGKELAEALSTLPDKLARNILRGAMRAGAAKYRNRARDICPIEPPSAANAYKKTLGWSPGALKRSLRVGVRVQPGGTVLATVKAGNKVAYYAHMVEFGTAAHWIKPKNAKALVIGGNLREAVHHPGARKNPFMRLTFDSGAQEAVDAVADYIRQRLTVEGLNTPDTSNAGAQT